MRKRTWLLLSVLLASILGTLTWLGTRKADFGDFDISRDGSEILFDRVQENSELALIERTH